eukprot:PhM_4_TR7320/c0_g1_i1/m.32564
MSTANVVAVPNSPSEAFAQSGFGELTDRFTREAARELPPRPIRRSGGKVDVAIGDYILHEYANNYAYRQTKELASKYNLVHNYGRVTQVTAYPDGSASIRYETLDTVDREGNEVMCSAQAPNSDTNIVVGNAEGFKQFNSRKRIVLSTLLDLQQRVVQFVVAQWSSCEHTGVPPKAVTAACDTMKEEVRLVQCAVCGLVLEVDLAMPRYKERPFVTFLSDSRWSSAHPPQKTDGPVVTEEFTGRTAVYPIEVEALLHLDLITPRDADVLRFRQDLMPYSWPLAWDNVVRSSKVVVWQQRK